MLTLGDDLSDDDSSRHMDLNHPLSPGHMSRPNLSILPGDFNDMHSVASHEGSVESFHSLNSPKYWQSNIGKKTVSKAPLNAPHVLDFGLLDLRNDAHGEHKSDAVDNNSVVTYGSVVEGGGSAVHSARGDKYAAGSALQVVRQNK
jgi:hypothetical protein